MRENTDKKSGIEILKEYYPGIFGPKFMIIQAMYFLLIMVLIYFLNKIAWWAPLLIQIPLAIIIPVLSLGLASKNAEKLREKYRKKYGDKAYPKFFNRYIYWMMVPIMIAFINIAIVYSNYIFPSMYHFGDNILYQALMPWWICIPIAIGLFIFAGLLNRGSINGGFDIDTEMFLYIIYPEKAKHIEGGVYNYVRHAHYSQGPYMAIALALLANSLTGFILAFMSIIGIYFVAKIEDYELIRRYGDSHEEYVKNKPMFFPKFKDIKGYMKLILTGKE